MGAGTRRAGTVETGAIRAGAIRAGAIRAVLAAALAVGVLLTGPAAAATQELKVELKAGAAVGNYTETDAGLDLLPRPTFGLLVELWATETLAGYAGITRASFGCEEGFCIDRDVSLTSEGLVVGGRWSPGLPWVRAGVAVQRLDIRATGANDRSDPDLGVELAAGVEVPLWDVFLVRPGLTYLRHNATTTQGDGHVSLLALEIGVAVAVVRF